ncbi:hypothetical protein F5B21DRAFT_274321 [Xylaria acuta]|nr:hypothetical protein F5B21DRAFT_274321 [Xylaria acuta]
MQRDNFDDPLCPALAPASRDLEGGLLTMPLLDPAQEVARIPASELPRCEEGRPRSRCRRRGRGLACCWVRWRSSIRTRRTWARRGI